MGWTRVILDESATDSFSCAFAGSATVKSKRLEIKSFGAIGFS
jgi:hypothetical protein